MTRDGFENACAVYGSNTAALEILSAAKQQGLVTALEQTIAPRAFEEELEPISAGLNRDSSQAWIVKSGSIDSDFGGRIDGEAMLLGVTRASRGRS